MAWRPHPRRASVDPTRPRAWATCDLCGFVTNQYKLNWDRQWAGNQIINLGFLVCDDCNDDPQEQLRTIMIPPDPAPLFNARPEPYAIDETNFYVTQNGSFLLTQGGDNLVPQGGG